MKIYARQVNPKYQESPFSLKYCDMFDELIITGNKDCIGITTHEWDALQAHFSDVVYEVEEDNDAAREIIENYFPCKYGKEYSDNLINEWVELSKEVVQRDYRITPEQWARALSLLTGKTYTYVQIHGCVQSEWNNCYYPVGEYDFRIIEADYFNTGTEWTIHDEEEAPETQEDINGYSVYCYAWNTEDIRKEIAQYAGGKSEDVILYKFNGQRTIDFYELV